MSRPKKKHLTQSSQRRSVGGPGSTARGALLAGRWACWCVGWYRAKNPVLRFVALFGLLIALFYAVALSSFFLQTILPPYLRFSARMANAVCNWIGEPTSVTGWTISSGGSSIEIAFGCDATEPIALFAAAVLAFPAPFRRKIPGILLGAGILAVMNLVRIVSLVLVGVYHPDAFEWMHREVWQVAFILLAIILWAVWIQWAIKLRPATVYARS